VGKEKEKYGAREMTEGGEKKEKGIKGPKGKREREREKRQEIQEGRGEGLEAQGNNNALAGGLRV
jgi:hypothetical protein